MSKSAPNGEFIRLYAAKAEAERAEADLLDPGSAAAGSFGPGAAAILLLRGEPHSSQAASGGPLSPPEAEAAARALAALGLPADDVAAVCTRSAGGADDSGSAARRLSLTVEASDPAWVIALDRNAGVDAASVLGLDALLPGVPLVRSGRVWLVVDDLEASLGDPARKRRVWAQLRGLADVRPEGQSAGSEPGPVGAGS